MTAAPSTSYWRDRCVLVTGGSGFVGHNLTRQLRELDCSPTVPERGEYDLREAEDTRHMLERTRPEIVFHLAGLVGGILPNTRRPADFAIDNLLIGAHGIRECHRAGVRRLVTLIPGCCYPADARTPIGEDQILDGPPQAESAPYSMAKRMVPVLANAYRVQHGFDSCVLLPGNLYGPYDDFDVENAHVIPALIRKFETARLAGNPSVRVWGSGRPVRDFVFVGDACEAILIAAERHSGPDVINLSTGKGISIRELVGLVRELTCYEGGVEWDASKPDGQANKLFDVRLMRELLGYEATTSLREGLEETIAWYRSASA